MKWKDQLAEMPKLSAEQIGAVKSIIDRHLADLVGDYPRVDDAVYLVQLNLDELKETP